MLQAASKSNKADHSIGTADFPADNNFRRPLFLILAMFVCIMPLLGNSYSAKIPSILIAVFPALLQIIFTGLTLLSARKATIPYKIPHYVLFSGAVWVFSSTISTVMGGHFMSSIIEHAEWLLLMLFTLSTAQYFFRFPEDRQKIIHLIGYGFAGYFLFLLVFIHLVPDRDNYPWVSSLPGFSNVRHFGYYATIVLATAYYGLLKKEFIWRSLQSKCAFLLLLICWTAIIWAGGRGPFLALGLTFLILVGFHSLPEWRRIVLVTIFILPFAVLFAEIIKVPHPSFGLGHLIGTIDAIVIDGDVNGYSSGRIDFWREAIGVIGEAPFFGYGPGMYSLVTQEPYSLYQHPHNSILQFALAWGMLGGITALLAIVFILRAAFRRLRQVSDLERPITLTVLAGILTILCFSLIDGTLFHTLPLTFFAIFCGMILLPSAEGGRRDVNIAGSLYAYMSGAILIFVTGLIALYAISLFSLYRPDIPRLASWRADIVQSFPVALRYYPGGITYGRWVDHWIEEGEPGVEEKILQSMDKSPGTWVNSLMLARLAEVRGEPQAAIDALKPLIIKSHPVIQYDANAILSRICGKYGVCLDPAQFK